MRLAVSRRACLVAGAALGLAFGCTDSSAGELARAPVREPAGEGGSPVSLDSALTLFRRDLDPLTELANGESSVDRVVARFVRSVERSDTADLRSLVMTRREFAYLYYPTSPLTRAPTKQEPALAWFLHVQNSQKGVTRLLDRYGARRLPIVRNDCNAPARIEGPNRFWDDCVQRIIQGRDTVVIRLFGGIYERDGRFKIFSYSNDL